MEVLCLSEAAPSGSTLITAPNGQYWIFDSSLTHGTYINGDPWVYNGGGVGTVTLLEVSTPTTGSGTTARHGGMINPTFNTLVEAAAFGGTPTTAMKQGYDGRVVQTSVLTYDATLNAHAALPLVMNAGETLVSSVSGRLSDPTIGSNEQGLDRMAAVTVVNHIPETDEFRPPYFGTTKTRWRYSDADLELLPDWEPESPFDPKYATGTGFHIDEASIRSSGTDISGYTNEEAMHLKSMRDLQYFIFPSQIHQSILKPFYNMWWYPAIWARYAGQMAMYAMCDFGGDRDYFIKRLLQVGIDAYAVAADGTRCAPFANGAGFFSSPLWMIRFAGLLFDHTPYKNAASISTGETNFYGVVVPKWGELCRVYLSTTAHPQYLRVPGEDYSGGFPLYGDSSTSDITTAFPDNGTGRDPDGVYDMCPYKIDQTTGTTLLPHASFPLILDDTYDMWKDGGVEEEDIGAYPFTYGYGPMGFVLASFAMGDEDFWGGAVVAYAKRYANDAQMWFAWGSARDYNTGYTEPYRPNRDVYAHGGSQNQWMSLMWDQIVGVPCASMSKVFYQALDTNSTGNESKSWRQLVTITGGAGTNNRIRVSFRAHSSSAVTLNHASIAISAGGGSPEDSTAAPVELTFGDGGHGFTIDGGGMASSDWATLGGFTIASKLLVTMDFAASNGNARTKSSVTGHTLYSTTAAAQYNVQNITPTGSTASMVGLVYRIEVQ